MINYKKNELLISYLKREKKKAHQRLAIALPWPVAHNQKELSEMIPTSLQKTTWQH